MTYHVWRPPEAFLLILVVWLAVATNEVIDVLGHVTQGGRPRRSFWTHSILTAPLWGMATAFPPVCILAIVFGQALTTPLALSSVSLGIAIAYSHLLLDVLTEGGVYLFRRRVAIAHLRYDNPVLNGAFIALGVLLVFAAVT